MFSSFSDFLSIALAIVALATLAGYGLLRGNVQNLRDQLKDEREARASLSTRFEDSRRENIDLISKVKVLESIVTGEVHWVALGQQLDEHHVDTKSFWERSEKQMTHQEHLLKEIRDALRTRP